MGVWPAVSGLHQPAQIFDSDRILYFPKGLGRFRRRHCLGRAGDVRCTTVLPPKADVHPRSCYVAFVPIATQRTAAKKASAIRSTRRRVTETIPGSSARAPWPFERRTHCDLGAIIAGAVQSFGRISTTNRRSGRFVLFCAVWTRFPVSK